VVIVILPLHFQYFAFQMASYSVMKTREFFVEFFIFVSIISVAKKNVFHSIFRRVLDLCHQGLCDVTPEGYHHLTRMLMNLANGRVVIVLEVFYIFCIVYFVSFSLTLQN